MNYDSWKLATPPEYDQANERPDDGVDERGDECPGCDELLEECVCDGGGEIDDSYDSDYEDRP